MQVHRDITSGNVLLTAKSSGASRSAGSRAGRIYAKVVDFGLCMLLPGGGASASTAQRGTLAYQPPELLAADAVSLATDCYAFGVLLWEMLTAQARPRAENPDCVYHTWALPGQSAC